MQNFGSPKANAEGVSDLPADLMTPSRPVTRETSRAKSNQQVIQILARLRAWRLRQTTRVLRRVQFRLKAFVFRCVKGKIGVLQSREYYSSLLAISLRALIRKRFAAW